ncbi:hypothetical protein SAMN04487833_1661 [Sarcina sp. DSM 11001]|uniref:hypothetical protein n=1 Tax=Sarcina sp. DSM 11001 TaxID=1798184 RepID=UPI00088640A0|nr:hypothetical protein [Sarcina sp. DSM 11001]SDM08344.1 hypothetical protein SAMN04487833_1661 [Sarcina sp. DSM 11001]
MANIDSWESFIRMHGGIVGARDCFEQVCDELLFKENSGRDVHRMHSAGGDGGIDIYVSNEDGSVDIYQCKFFRDHLDSSKWEQIKSSFKTLISGHSKLKLNIRTWYLCLPKQLLPDEIATYEKFKHDREQEGICIRLIDGKDLILRITEVGLADKWFGANSDLLGTSNNLIPIYLSYPTPHTSLQLKFIEYLKADLIKRGLYPRNVGSSEYSMDAPLTAISRVMTEVQGCLCVAFRRVYIENAVMKKGANVSDQIQENMSQYWYTSPFVHIEPAMAFQMKLPTLIFKEKDVAREGMLDPAIRGIYLPEFELSAEEPISAFFESQMYVQLIEQYAEKVLWTSKPINRECSVAEFFQKR